jgi:hypothetical protein
LLFPFREGRPDPDCHERRPTDRYAGKKIIAGTGNARAHVIAGIGTAMPCFQDLPEFDV